VECRRRRSSLSGRKTANFALDSCEGRGEGPAGEGSPVMDSTWRANERGLRLTEEISLKRSHFKKDARKGKEQNGAEPGAEEKGPNWFPLMKDRPRLWRGGESPFRLPSSSQEGQRRRRLKGAEKKSSPPSPFLSAAAAAGGRAGGSVCKSS